MLKRLIERYFLWYRGRNCWQRTRKYSDYRATTTAQKLICSGALQNQRLAGSPLARGVK